ncbi:MAG TPA: hypothetical protein DCY88_16490 [Cyanobacteria bacterium UBA11372]|nr:hypothetical protein [Cyanobacteria bacterium UBA11372]HBE36908.1 hypothetical protein [Cyanobacteria bacterium UBA11368]
MTKNLSIVAAGAALLTFGTMGAVHGAAIVPGNLENIEGNVNHALPFNISNFGLSSSRYQQVFAASEFSSLSESFLITQILFRPDARMGSAFSSTLPNVQINLSTTTKAPDGLSTIFAQNIGSDERVVFSGALSLSSAFTGAATEPKDFDIAINLATPFLYNPSGGNLLLDVRNFAGGFSTQFDGENTLGDYTSRVTSTLVGASGGSASTSGLVTKFVTTPAVPAVPAVPGKAVPEPASVLGIFAVAAFGATSARKRKGFLSSN